MYLRVYDTTVFPLINHTVSVALAEPEPAELCSNGKKVQIAEVIS